jgi:hypothetical protein
VVEGAEAVIVDSVAGQRGRSDKPSEKNRGSAHLSEGVSELRPVLVEFWKRAHGPRRRRFRRQKWTRIGGERWSVSFLLRACRFTSWEALTEPVEVVGGDE